MPVPGKHAQRRAGRLGRAETVLAINARIDVVQHHHRPTEFVLQHPAKWHVLPPQIRRLVHNSLLLVHRTRHSDADAAQLSHFDSGIRHRVLNGGNDSRQYRLGPLVALGLPAPLPMGLNRESKTTAYILEAPRSNPNQYSAFSSCTMIILDLWSFALLIVVLPAHAVGLPCSLWYPISGPGAPLRTAAGIRSAIRIR